MKIKKALISDMIFIVIGSCSGVIGIVVPYLISGSYDPVHANSNSIFPVINAAWEGLSLIPTLLIMVAVGLGLGFINPKRWLILGLTSILFLVILAIVEMSLHPTSHNLWPFEFILYFALIALPAVIGTFIGSRIKKWSIAT